MSHELEMINGKASMAYVGETPWHGLGQELPLGVTPQQMLEAAQLDWSVEKHPVYADVNGVRVATSKKALVRSNDNRVMSIVGEGWNPVQNSEAFNFFNDWVAAGEMEMCTAGALKDGEIVWALAKVNESFDILNGQDTVDSYMLFTNPHQFGKSMTIMDTMIRVVCNNTLTWAHQVGAASSKVSVSHRSVFDADRVKMALGISKERLAAYKERAEYLTTKRFDDESIVEYFKRVFPMTTKKGQEDDRMSRRAQEAMYFKDTQPGAALGEGSFWQLFNTVTYMIDHEVGTSDDSRLASAWYGHGSAVKKNAMEVALEMATAA